MRVPNKSYVNQSVGPNYSHYQNILKSDQVIHHTSLDYSNLEKEIDNSFSMDILGLKDKIRSSGLFKKF
jgi:hypothetical protein